MDGDPAPFEEPEPAVAREQPRRSLPWQCWLLGERYLPPQDPARDVRPHELADAVLAALRRWPSRYGRRYALALLAGSTQADRRGDRPSGVALCGLMRSAVARIRQGDRGADPHWSDPYDYAEVDTYLIGGANQLPCASSLQGGQDSLGRIRRLCLRKIPPFDESSSWLS